MSKSLVLLSGGLDSSFGFWREAQSASVALAITFDYGQRAAPAELKAAAALCERAGVEHLILKLPFFSLFSQSSLTDALKPLPIRDDVAIDNLVQSEATMKSVWVPNRNGIFLNIAAGVAEGRGIERVMPGFNIEEAATFPDNSEAYLQSLNQSFEFSTLGKVKVHCHSTAMSKTEIAVEGQKIQLPFELLWPCYQNGPTWCGDCESCLRSRRAFREAGVSDSQLPWSKDL